MVNKKVAPKSQVVNKQAKRDYEIIKTFMAGLVLTGAEVKSLRHGHGQLRGAFVNIKDGEIWLYNAMINPTNANKTVLNEVMQIRSRKLLLKKKEIDELATAKEQSLTIIPLKILTNGRFIKIEIAVAKGLKKFDKRQKIKKRDTDRDNARTLSRK